MSSYLKKGGVAIVDQVLFSGSNFLLNIFLVKLLTPSEYGVFGSLYSLYLLLFVAFAAVLLEPYMYYKNKLENSEKYTRLYAGFSNNLVLFSLVVVLIGIIFHETIIIYISFIITTCIIYFYKRHFFAVLQPVKSLYISIAYFVLMITGLFLLYIYPEKNLFNAFLMLYSVSLISILPTIVATNEFKSLVYTNKDWSIFLSMLKEQKSFSLHCLSSSVLAWIPSNVYFVLIPILFSSAMNGEFKAIQNINLPIYHFNIAIVSLLTPIFIKSPNTSKIIRHTSITFIALPLVYLFIILFLLDPIQEYIYNNKYNINHTLVIIMVIGIIPEILSNIYKAYFRSIKRPEVVTKINLINAGVSILFIYVVYRYALYGVVVSYLAINIFNFLNSVIFFSIESKTHKKLSPEMA